MAGSLLGILDRKDLYAGVAMGQKGTVETAVFSFTNRFFGIPGIFDPQRCTSGKCCETESPSSSREEADTVTLEDDEGENV